MASVFSDVNSRDEIDTTSTILLLSIVFASFWPALTLRCKHTFRLVIEGGLKLTSLSSIPLDLLEERLMVFHKRTCDFSLQAKAVVFETKGCHIDRGGDKISNLALNFKCSMRFGGSKLIERELQGQATRPSSFFSELSILREKGYIISSYGPGNAFLSRVEFHQTVRLREKRGTVKVKIRA